MPRLQGNCSAAAATHPEVHPCFEVPWSIAGLTHMLMLLSSQSAMPNMGTLKTHMEAKHPRVAIPDESSFKK